MKIGIISDTHISEKSKDLPESVLLQFTNAKMILHAGDHVHQRVIDQLMEVAPVISVRGNMDNGAFAENLPVKKVITVGGFNIGLIHGWGSPINLSKRVLSAFDDEQLDCIIFGHSHIPVIKKVNRVLLVNPGSPTDKLFAPYRSVGTLKLELEIKAEIIKLSG